MIVSSKLASPPKLISPISSFIGDKDWDFRGFLAGDALGSRSASDRHKICVFYRRVHSLDGKHHRLGAIREL
jgi:hypothetical protein